MTADECNTVQMFLDAGGIVVIVFLFIARDFFRWKFQAKESE